MFIVCNRFVEELSKLALEVSSIYNWRKLDIVLHVATENLKHVANLLRTKGAFAWWYVDLVDDDGRGLVLVGSFGLPFLPGSRGCPRPVDRPSLALALYDQDRSVFYALQTFEPEEASLCPAGQMTFGRSRMGLALGSKTVTLEVELDLDVPGGGRLTGTVSASGPRCLTPDPTVGNVASGAHRWAPILVAQRGRASLSTSDGETFDVDGRIYVDSNASREPLHDLGIADWRWGRVAFPDRELIYYVVEPVDSQSASIRHVIEAWPDGRLVAHDARPRWRAPRRSIYSLGYHRGLELTSSQGLDVELTMRALVDDGPFYLRFLVDASDGATGATGRGFAERVVPDEVDRPWQRPFVRMRTHRTSGDNSMWLPLFTGPRRGRLERLLKHWRSAPGVVGATP